MTPHQLLQQLGLAMSLPGLAFNAQGCARVLVDGAIAVNFELDDARACIHVYSTLAPLPAQGREALLMQLLEGNLFGAQTLGATLAVDSLHQEVVLCQAVTVATADVAAFSDAVERFVAVTQEWTDKLARGLPAAPAADAPVAASLMEPRVMAHFLRV